MNTQTKHIGTIAALAIVAAALAATSGMANGANETASCGVVTSTQDGMLTIQGTILSPKPLSGSYQLSVHSSGGGNSSNINQGGNFSAEANQETALGKVMINASANPEVKLEVTANGEKLDCDEIFAGTV